MVMFCDVEASIQIIPIIFRIKMFEFELYKEHPYKVTIPWIACLKQEMLTFHFRTPSSHPPSSSLCLHQVIDSSLSFFCIKYSRWELIRSKIACWLDLQRSALTPSFSLKRCDVICVHSLEFIRNFGTNGMFHALQVVRSLCCLLNELSTHELKLS